jgi:hypothetical protein
MLKLLTEGWEKWELEPVEISHLDGDRYLFVGRMTITGRGSGVPVSAGGARTYVFNDDDKIVRSIFFQNREDAAGSAAPQL